MVGSSYCVESVFMTNFVTRESYKLLTKFVGNLLFLTGSCFYKLLCWLLWVVIVWWVQMLFKIETWRMFQALTCIYICVLRHVNFSTISCGCSSMILNSILFFYKKQNMKLSKSKKNFLNELMFNIFPKNTHNNYPSSNLHKWCEFLVNINKYKGISTNNIF
jgi:hypothetical protein